MRTSFLFLLFCGLLISNELFATENSIQSKEKIIFHKSKVVGLESLNKIPEFTGIIERVNSKSKDLKAIDLYQFKLDALKVNKKLCADLVEKMFGISQSKLYGVKSSQIVESNKGDICKYHITDKVKEKKIEDEYHRLILIGFINTKAHAIVFYPDTINDTKTSEALQFWNDLR